MFRINLADIVVEIDNRYSGVEDFCRGYKTIATSPAFRVSVSYAEISSFRANFYRPISEEEAETILVYRKICSQIPPYRAFLFHSAFFTCHGYGIAVSAKRGTGKTTHLTRWREVYGDDVMIVNGDKPIFRFEQNRLFGYGSPWCGKEGLGTNTSAKLDAILFYEQSSDGKTTLSRLTPQEAAPRMVEQVIYPADDGMTALFADLLAQALKTVPCFLISATPDKSAAQIAHDYLVGHL